MNKLQITESIQWALIGFMGTMTLLFLFPPDYLLAKQFSAYAIHWMLLCLGIGIIALFLKNEKFLYTGFFCCGIIAFYLMNSFNTDLRLANFNNPESITLVFGNLTLTDDEPDKTISSIYFKDADIIILEELRPSAVPLLEKIKTRYPYQYILPRLDPLGKAVLSKFTFRHEEQFVLGGIPVLRLELLNGAQTTFNIIVSNSIPPITMNSYEELSGFLDSLAVKIAKEYPNAIVASNFNLVPWSVEIRKFRDKASLNSSRRDNREGSDQDKTLGILNTPNNEIFYSKDLECTMFRIINDSRSKPVGLFGRYQMRNANTQNEL